MKNYLGILLCFALLALAGCKLEHISRVKLSQMSNLSEDIRQKISEAKKNAMTKDLKFNVIIKFINDTNEELKIFPSAVYVDDIAFAGLPAWGNNYTILPKKTATIILSNVASDYVVSNGLVPVFSEAQKQNTKE